MRFSYGLALAALASTGCSTTYAFVPSNTPTVALYGHPAASYAIPPQSPHGFLRIASYGIEPLSSPEAPDESVAALHVRLSVSNTSDQTWTADTRQQQAYIEGHATSTPTFATASPGGSAPPEVTIAAHTSRLVDLFFVLPASAQDASAFRGFQLTTTVQTGSGNVTETTPFQRVEVDSDSPAAYDYSAPQAQYNPDVYGYDYWDSPFYYNPMFVGFDGMVYPTVYWGRPYYARGWGWGRPGYYHGWHGPMGGYRGGYRGGGFHGGRR